jgi:hypothetical protein
MSRLFRSLSNAFWCLTTAEDIHYASTLSCMPSTKGIPLRLLSIHRSLACHCPVSRDTPRQTPCISYLSHAFHYSLRDLSASDTQRHTLCIRSLSHAVRCLATAEGIPYASFLHPLSLACRPARQRVLYCVYRPIPFLAEPRRRLLYCVYRSIIYLASEQCTTTPIPKWWSAG